MNRKKFDWIASLVTLLSCVGSAVAMYFLTGGAPSDDSLLPWWMGLFFLVVFAVGFAALHIYLHFSKYKVQRPKFWYIWALVAAILIFLLGSGGEYVYTISKEESKTEKETTKADVDVVLLLDCSGSMEGYGYDVLRNEAAENFVNGLDDSCQLQIMCFAGGVNEIDASELLKMDDSGKATAIDFIKNMDCYGTTDYDSALESALNTFKTNSNVREDSEKAVILLTDGEVLFLVGDYFQDYLDEEIQLHTIRIYWTDDVGPETQRLIDFTKDSGGSDTLLKPDDDGKIDSSAILKAFNSAYTSSSCGSTTTQTTTTDDLLICTGSVGFWRVILRTVALMAIAVLFAMGYFGRFSWSGALIGCGIGVVISILAALIDSALVCMILAAALFGTAIVFYHLPESGEFDV